MGLDHDALPLEWRASPPVTRTLPRIYHQIQIARLSGPPSETSLQHIFLHPQALAIAAEYPNI